MMAKSQITKQEVFEAIEKLIKEKYGIVAKDITIDTFNGDVVKAVFKFDVPVVKGR